MFLKHLKEQLSIMVANIFLFARCESGKLWSIINLFESLKNDKFNVCI